jgi:hypothetical protein
VFQDLQLQCHQRTHKAERRNGTNRAHISSTVRIARIRLFGELRIGASSSGAVLALAGNGLCVISSGGDSPGSRRLGPGDDGAAGRSGDGATNIGQSRGAVLGEVTGLVEFVRGVVEANVLALEVVQSRVTGVPGPVRDRVVQVGQVVGEEDGP